MTGTDLCVNLVTSVPVIFEPPCISFQVTGTEFNNKMEISQGKWHLET